jgi:(S)-2-hydroxyglutarate dehydrogenase
VKHQRVAVIGGGIVGAAVARRLHQIDADLEVTLLEKESRLAAHQTGRNSGVVHAGLYYTPGSLKAHLCRRGVSLLHAFCDENGVAYNECGKVLVALDDVEGERLAAIMERAVANGVPGVRLVDSEELRAIEPHVRGIAGLHSPHTAIVDFPGATQAMGDALVASGGRVRTNYEVRGISERPSEVVLRGSAGQEDAFDLVIVCAGLQTDRVAAMAGGDADPRIIPFRGEYYLLREDRRDLVRGLVYPVPDPRYPFLGVHMTPRVDGEVMVGPNAVFALAREGYSWRDFSAKDVWEAATWPGFRRFARKHWRTGAGEVWGSISKRHFAAAARRYVPEITGADMVPGPSGVRAQALGRDGDLVDDFRVSIRGRIVSVRNAPSPAATSSLAIAEHVCDLALGRPIAFEGA